jgi:threonine dehydratase
MHITIDAIRAARERLAGIAVRTPLLRLGGEGAEDIWIKPEVLQPIGSFKIRGAYNAVARQREAGAQAVFTLSAGNMSQGVAWSARRLGLRARAIMPDAAPRFKIEATRGLGAEIELVDRESGFVGALREGRYDGQPGFVHPVNDPDVIAGNGTVGLEIAEELPDVDTVIVPVGGGGLLIGIATALRHLNPNVTVYGVQPAAACGLKVSLEAGRPATMQASPTFVDGAGFPGVIEPLFPALQQLAAGCLTATDDETKAAIYRLATRNKLVAEGAGALAVAAALQLPRERRGKTICIVSGGSIDPGVLAGVLLGSDE